MIAWILGVTRLRIRLARLVAGVAPPLFRRFLARSLEKGSQSAAGVGRLDKCIEWLAEAERLRLADASSLRGGRRLAYTQALLVLNLARTGRRIDGTGRRDEHEYEFVARDWNSSLGGITRARIALARAVLDLDEPGTQITALRAITDDLQQYRRHAIQRRGHIAQAHAVIGSVRERQGEHGLALDATEDCVRWLGRIPWPLRNPVFSVTVQLRYAGLLRAAERFDEALRVAQKSRITVEIADDLLGDGPVLGASRALEIAGAAAGAGDYKRAGQACATAIEMLGSLIDKDWDAHVPQLSYALRLRAHIRADAAVRKHGSDAPSERKSAGGLAGPARESISDLSQLVREDPIERCAGFVRQSLDLADLLRGDGDKANAVEVCETTAREVRRALATEESSDELLRTCLREVSTELYRLGQNERAVVLAEECVAIGRARGDQLELAVDLTHAAHYAGDRETVLARSGEAIDLFEGVGADANFEEFLHAYAMRSQNLSALGRHEEAHVLASRLIISASQADDEACGRYWRVAGLDIRCNARHQRGDYTGALNDIELLLSIITTDEDRFRHKVPTWQSRKAWILAHLGRHHEAVATLHELRLWTMLGEFRDNEHAHLFNRVLEVAPEEIMAAWHATIEGDWPVPILDQP